MQHQEHLELLVLILITQVNIITATISLLGIIYRQLRLQEQTVKLLCQSMKHQLVFQNRDLVVLLIQVSSEIE
jgi:hypothetical protein